MTTAEVQKENCLKYFGQEKEDETSPNYKKYVEAMRAWYTSYEYHCQMMEDEEEEYVKDWIDIDCDKYHEWRDEH